MYCMSNQGYYFIPLPELKDYKSNKTPECVPSCILTLPSPIFIQNVIIFLQSADLYKVFERIVSGCDKI